MTRRISRRKFLAAAGAAIAAPTFLRARNLNSKLNIAMIACGGRGAANLKRRRRRKHRRSLRRQAKAPSRRPRPTYPHAKKFTDFRKIFDNPKAFDAVVVSTCEHTHAFATMLALENGKHVYCEKPLTYNICEARKIREEAAKSKVTTMMGIQNHANDNYRKRGRIDPGRRHRPGARGPRLGVACLGTSEPGSVEEERRKGSRWREGARLRHRPSDQGRARPGRSSTGISGSGRRRCVRSATSMSPVRAGIAGGISATAP